MAFLDELLLLRLNRAAGENASYFDWLGLNASRDVTPLLGSASGGGRLTRVARCGIDRRRAAVRARRRGQSGPRRRPNCFVPQQSRRI